MDLSIVIPAYNESGYARSLINEIHSSLSGRLEYEIIYVDDGSNDNTADEIIACQQNDSPGLRMLRHKNNYGQSAAIITGVIAANTEWIVTLDADGQNDPADILALWNRLRRSEHARRPQIITGYRRVRQDNPVKRFSSRIANGVRKALLNDGTPDTGCGLKIFSRAAFLELPRFDHMHRFLPALFLRNGGTVEVVEVNHRPRTTGQSKYGISNRLWVGIIDLLGVMWLIRRKSIPELLEEHL